MSDAMTAVPCADCGETMFVDEWALKRGAPITHNPAACVRRLRARLAAAESALATVTEERDRVFSVVVSSSREAEDVTMRLDLVHGVEWIIAERDSARRDMANAIGQGRDEIERLTKEVALWKGAHDSCTEAWKKEQAKVERLRDLVRAEIALLRAWVKESNDGGWSTHQVDPMLRRANDLAAVLGER